LILSVAKARLDEIFEMIKKQIIGSGLSSSFGTNFFIVGGGSNLLNLEEYCSNFFELKVKKIGKNNKKKNETQSEENFISCLGALKIVKDGWETEAIPEPINKNSQKISFFAKIFRNRQ